MINLGYFRNTPSLEVCPNQAAVLLFHDYPENYIPESNISITQFAGIDNNNILKRDIFGGGLIRQLNSCFHYIKSINGYNAKIQETKLKYQNFEYPLDVIGEVLVNAIVHRTYGYEMPIRVSLFSDRMEILNPGNFFAPINEQTLQLGLSRYRNPLIANAFRRAKLMEKQGIGINKIFEGCSSAGLPLPKFQEIENFVKVTLFNQKSSLNKNKLKPDNSYSEFTAIFDIHTYLSSQRFADLIGKSQSTAKVILRKMVEQKLILREGSGRGTVYSIADR